MNKVAETILDQLGGHGFIIMTGAKMFVGSPNSLNFKLPLGFAENRINWVLITLDADDTYTMRFASVRGLTQKDVAIHTGIYCDMLVDIFERETGLRCSLAA